MNRTVVPNLVNEAIGWLSSLFIQPECGSASSVQLSSRRRCGGTANVSRPVRRGPSLRLLDCSRRLCERCSCGEGGERVETCSALPAIARLFDTLCCLSGAAAAKELVASKKLCLLCCGAQECMPRRVTEIIFPSIIFLYWHWASLLAYPFTTKQRRAIKRVFRHSGRGPSIGEYVGWQL